MNSGSAQERLRELTEVSRRPGRNREPVILGGGNTSVFPNTNAVSGKKGRPAGSGAPEPGGVDKNE